MSSDPKVPQKIYQERIAEAQSKLSAAEKQLSKLSWIRLLIFIVTAVLLGYWGNLKEGWLFTGTLVTGGLLFIWMVVKHSQQQAAKSLQEALLILNKEELSRLSYQWNVVEDRYMPKVDLGHPYAHDLDIAGNVSVFKMLCRTGSQLGADVLQNWLLKASDKSVVIARQKMVKSLIPQLELRQHLQAYGLVNRSGEEGIEGLLEWMKAPMVIKSNSALMWVSRIGPIIALGGLICLFMLDWPLSIVALFLIPNGWVLLKTAAYIGKAVEQTSKYVKHLRQLQQIMQLIEENDWQEEGLKQLAAPLKEASAASKVKELSEILYKIEARTNPWFYALVNVFVLYDVFWTTKLERWKLDYQPYLEDWLQNTATIEALSSLAGFAYNHPSYCFPEFSEERFCIKAQQMGHPLINSEQRVCNDFEFAGQGVAGIITGSNMSGKSTFERTVGVNALLAFAGAPVCAEALLISPFQLFTSMRTQDSLEENVSGFYAELKRLEQLIKLLETDQDIFYVLDEVLKGTNSADRNAGAQAIIKQLSKHRTFGLVSTHDLSLGELATQHPSQMQNFSFNSRIENGKLFFDYQISKGVCHSFSATALMKQIGIEME